jgi:hypothetical protein
MALIKQWFTTRHRFSSDIIQPIIVLCIVFRFPSLNLFQYADDIALTHPARKFEECEIHLEKASKFLVDSLISGVYVQIHQKLKSARFTWEHMMPTES